MIVIILLLALSIRSNNILFKFLLLCVTLKKVQLDILHSYIVYSYALYLFFRQNRKL